MTNINDFDIRVKRELEIYNEVHENGGDRASIPGMATYWSTRYLSPRLRNIFGEVGINTLYASEIVERAKLMGLKDISCLSLGSGDCVAEFDIAHKVIEKGINIKLTCTDLNPVLMDASREKAKEIGLFNNFVFEALDINIQFPKAKYDVIIVSHALHHFIELEKIILNVYDNLNAGGCFIVSDMIGRNGHMRWPEALNWVEALWKTIPKAKKLNNFTKKYDDPYINFDCSEGCFEGIRSQDIYPLLIKYFDFEKFVGLGGLIDIFTDRIYGPNFSPDNKWDVGFIDFVESLNNNLIDLGVLKPTAMFGTLVKKVQGTSPPKCSYDRWSPVFCLRMPD